MAFVLSFIVVSGGGDLWAGEGVGHTAARMTGELGAGFLGGILGFGVGVSLATARSGYWGDTEVREAGGKALVATLCTALGTTTGIYLVGVSAAGDWSGQFEATLAGGLAGGVAAFSYLWAVDASSSLFPGLLTIPLSTVGAMIGFELTTKHSHSGSDAAIPRAGSKRQLAAPHIQLVLGMMIGLNLTRRYKPSALSETALINFSDGKMSLAVPRITFRPAPHDKGTFTQNVELVKLRF